MKKENQKEQANVIEVDPDKIKNFKILLPVQTAVMILGFVFTGGLVWSNFASMKDDLADIKERGTLDRKELLERIDVLTKTASEINDRTIKLETKMELIGVKK